MLIFIGSFGIVFTVLIYSFLFYQLRSGHLFDKPLIEVTRIALTRAVKNIEFYKSQNGVYPDSIEQIRAMDSRVMMEDPVLSRNARKHTSVYFHYHRIGEKYTIFSVGLDKIPNTNDDIYPSVSNSDIGLIKR